LPFCPLSPNVIKLREILFSITIFKLIPYPPSLKNKRRGKKILISPLCAAERGLAVSQKKDALNLMTLPYPPEGALKQSAK